MAEHFGCSHSVVKRKLYSFGLKSRARYSNLGDEELETIMKEFHKSHPNAGIQMMTGYLRSMGHTVQRRKIIHTLDKIDPLAGRWSRTVVRRVYAVPTPNCLWHIDSHMKLIRWGFATHGCVDGYSRLVIYLNCATDNLASTVLALFVQATKAYGLPPRVRSDYGGENFHVALFMNLVHKSEGRNHLTGQSVHNQRIERLWKDCFVQAVEPFYELFYSYEDEGILDPSEPTSLAALQLVYLPEINKRLEEFRKGWNEHPVRTESNRTPKQIWIDGMLSNMYTSSSSVNAVFQNQPLTDVSLWELLQDYGLQIDQFEHLTQDEQFEAVEVPSANLDIVEELVQTALGDVANIDDLQERFLRLKEILHQLQNWRVFLRIKQHLEMWQI